LANKAAYGITVMAAGRVSPLRAAAGHRPARRGLTRPTRSRQASTLLRWCAFIHLRFTRQKSWKEMWWFPFASITWSRFNGSAALPRCTLSLCDGTRRHRLAPHSVSEL